MLKIWLALIVTMIFQETATSSLLLHQTKLNHIQPLTVTYIWLLSTSFDIFIGYFLSQWIKRRFSNKNIVQRITRYSDHAQKVIGAKGETVGLAILSVISFPYINSFIGGWLGLSLPIIFLATFLGNVLWYLTIWGTVAGTSNITHQLTAIFVTIAVTLTATFLVRWMLIRSISKI